MPSTTVSFNFIRKQTKLFFGEEALRLTRFAPPGSLFGATRILADYTMVADVSFGELQLLH